MVSDQEIANGVETLLRQSDPNAVTTLNGVVEQLGAKLGLDLTHKAGFIRDQINLIFRSHPKPQPQPQPQQQHPPPPKDHFALQHHHPQFQNAYHQQQQQQQIPSHFALLHHQQQHQQHQHQHQHDLNFSIPVSQPPPQNPQVQSQHSMKKGEVFAQTAATGAVASGAMPKESAPAGTKRRGGPGGLNKVCGVTPELQAVVGEPALPRTEIVKQLWAYIRKHNLQDPSNKRKIICDEALRLLFETDCTDMFKMNKLLSKHIIPLGPKKEPKAKRLKVEEESTIETAELGPSSVIISEALSKFFGTGEREMLHSEALGRVWEFIKVNRLEDPLNANVILCDAKLQELLGCESISALGIPEMLARHHLFKRS